MDTIKYFVWPDGTYLSEHDYSWAEYSHWGEDYAVVHVPLEIEFETEYDLFCYLLIKTGQIL